MTGHRPRPMAAPPPIRTILVAAVGVAAEADNALAAGADMIDGSGLSGQAVAALRARHRGVRLWAGAPAAVDADGQAPAPPVAAVVARAAVLTWLGSPAIRSRHVLPVRRAIDMASSIAGTRLPRRTTRGLG